MLNKKIKKNEEEYENEVNTHDWSTATAALKQHDTTQHNTFGYKGLANVVFWLARCIQIWDSGLEAHKMIIKRHLLVVFISLSII